MKKFLASIGIIIAFLAGSWFILNHSTVKVQKEGSSVSLGLSTYLTVQGGTGTTSPSGILYGDNGSTSHLNTVKIGSGCTFTSGVLSCLGVGGTNYLTASSSAAYTYLNTGTFLQAPALFATSTSATSTIANLNGAYYVSPSTTDIFASANALYALATTPNVTIVFPAGNFTTATPLVCGTNNKLCTIIGNGATVNYTGTATSTTINVNTSVSANYGIFNLKLVGPSSAGTTVGIQIGGSNGAANVTISGVQVRGFGKGLVSAANTYLEIIENNTFNFNGQALYIAHASNAGEEVRATNNVFADCNTITNCVFVEQTSDFHSAFNSYDDSSVHIGDTVNIASFDHDHWEPPGGNAYGTYDFLTVDSSPATHASVTNSQFYNSAWTTSVPNEFIKTASQIEVKDTTFNRLGGTMAIPYLVTTDESDAYAEFTGIRLINTPYTNIWNGSIAPVVYSVAASGSYDFMQNVGIGTTSPDHKLTIQGTGNYGIANIVSNGTNQESAINFRAENEQNSDGWLAGTWLSGSSDFTIFQGISKKLSISRTGFGTTTVTGFTVNGSATSTSNVGFNVTSGCYAVNGTCIKSGTTGVTSVATNNGLTGGTITSTGTLGLDISKLSTNGLVTWNGSQLVASGTPQLTVGNLLSTSSAISSFKGNVGIGTLTATSPLQVASDISGGGGSDYYQITSTLASTPATGMTMGFDQTNNYGILFARNAGGASRDIHLGSPYDAYGYLTVRANGNVGLSSTSPYGRLTITGIQGSLEPLIIADMTDTNFATTTVFSVSGSGFSTTTVAGLNIVGQATSTSNVGFNLTNGCYAISGTCLPLGGSGTLTSITNGKGLYSTQSPLTTSGTFSIANQQAYFIVSTTTATGDFTSVQSAINALPASGGLIHVKAGTYILPTGNVGIQPKVSNTIIEGEGNSTQFNFDKANTTNAYEPASSNLTGLVLKDVYFHQTNATFGGIGINASNTPLFIAQRIKIDGTATTTSVKDTQNLSFYQHYTDMDFRDNTSCVDIGGLPVNDNIFENIRCAAHSGNKGFALYLDSSSVNGAQNNTFINFDSEPTGAATGLTAMYLNNAVDNQFFTSYVEGNATGWNLTANSQRNTFHGGEFLTNTTYINNGSNNQWLGTDKEAVAYNLIMASTTIADVSGNDASVPSLSFIGNTNFAKTTPVLKINLANSTDSGQGILVTNPGTGTTTQIVATGTGMAFEVDDQVNDTSPFLIDANGTLMLGGQTFSTANVNIMKSNGGGMGGELNLANTAGGQTSNASALNFTLLNNGGFTGSGTSMNAQVKSIITGGGNLTDMVLSTYDTSTLLEGLRITNGNVGVGGTTTPFATFAVNPIAGKASNQFIVGSSTATNFKIDNSGRVFAPNTTTQSAAATDFWCYDTNGQFIRVTNTCTVSALKFKKDITPLKQGLDAVLAMKPVNYYLNDLGLAAGKTADNVRQQIGFVADYSDPIVPLLVTHDNAGAIHGFNYEQYTAVLTKAVQELNAKVDNIKAGKTARSVEENWQWILIALLAVGFIYQQRQINKLKNK